MNRRTKQIVYGAGYLSLWFLIFWGAYKATVEPLASCTDGRQNRDEVEADCGGAYCESCDIRRLSPIQLSAVELVAGATGTGTSAVFQIQNPNAAYGTERFSYVLRLYGGGDTLLFEEPGNVAVYPSEIKSRVVVNAPVDIASVVSSVATSTGPVAWTSITEIARPKVPTREIRFTYLAAEGRGSVSGIVKNDNAFPLRRVTIGTLFYDRGGRLVAVSKTFVQDLLVGEERAFTVDVPFGAGVDPSTLPEPRVTIDAERF